MLVAVLLHAGFKKDFYNRIEIKTSKKPKRPRTNNKFGTQ